MKTNNSKIAKRQNTYNSRGITLIALVVTILVLIILAGVSINLVLGDNGIITKAKQAKEQYEMAQVKEKLEMTIIEIQSEVIASGKEMIIDELLEKLSTKLPEIIITKEGNTLKGTYEGYDFTIDESFKVTIDGYNPSAGGNTPAEPEEPETYIVTFNGTNVTSNGASTINAKETYSAKLTPTTGYEIASITIKMGETTLVENTNYTYTDGTIEIPNVSGNIEINVVTSMTTSLLKAGDYIKYNTGVASVGENGVITCRVLYDASSEHGLQIISDKNVADVTLGGSDWATGRDSYNSAIETLNNEAEKYINPTYVTDARCVGSVPTIDANGTFTEKDTENAGPVTLQFSSSVSGANNMKGADTNYTSNGEEGIVRDKETMETLGIWTTEEYYWLASRNVFSDSSDCIFYVRYVNASGGLYNYDLCDVYSDGDTYGDSYSYGLRPCFSLKSDITITGGDGTSEAPYTM